MILTRPLFPTTLFILIGIAAVAGCSQSTQDDVGASEGAQTQARAVPAVGEYESNNDSRSGFLKINSTSPSSIDFELSVFNNFGGHNHGIIDHGTARSDNGVFKYTAENCLITFKASQGSIEVAQEGTCDFGAFVDATGTYAPKAPEPQAANLCTAGEHVVFGCKTTTNKVLSICGYKGAAQYRFGTAANVEMKLPAEMAPIADKPEIAEGGYISLAGPGAGGAWATFHKGAYDYAVVTINSSRGLDEEGRSLGIENTSGVVVTKNGARIAFVKCAEEPTSDLPSELIATSSKNFDLDLIP